MSLRALAPAATVLGLLAAGAAVLVASTLRRPEVPSFPPTAPEPREVGTELVGPRLYTIEAPEQDRWRYFDFSRGSVVEDPGPVGWDLAVQRFTIIVNGGEGFAGTGGVLDLGEVAFDGVVEAPEAGYQVNLAARDTVNPAFRRWYDYGFTSHLLTPKPRVYVVRTADGRFAKLEILSYYCPGATPGCLTIRYLYQGGGGAALRGAP